MRQVRRTRKIKPSVTWTGDTTLKTDMQLNSELPVHRAPREIPSDIVGSLSVGALFTTKVHLEPRHDSGYEWAPLVQRYVMAYESLEDVPVPIGSLAMYSGEVRVAEQANRYANRSTVIQAIKHTFIVNGQRVIIHDLSWLQPA